LVTVDAAHAGDLGIDGKRQHMRVEALPPHRVDQFQHMRSARARPADDDGDRDFVIGIVVADRIGEERQRHQSVSRQRMQRLKRRRQQRAQFPERREHQGLHVAGAVVEVRRPGRADPRGDHHFRDAPEEIDVTGGGILRHLVEIGVGAKAVVIAALRHHDLVAGEFDFREFLGHEQ
jgi:hypothetical protein